MKRDMHTEDHRPLQVVAMLAVLALLALGAVADSASGNIDTDSQAFHQFRHRVCRAFAHEDKRAATYVAHYNYYFYNTAHTPENLRTAGGIALSLYSVYSDESRRIRRFRAPAGLGALWHRYNTQERQIIKFGLLGAHALLRADEATFKTYEAKDLSWQGRRDETYNRMELDC